MLQKNDHMMAKDKCIILLFCAAVFLFLFVFFVRIHPILVFDTDDWKNITYTRHAVPLWGSRNPIKVLPETLMSLCGYLAAFFVYPVTGDYIGSFTIVNAGVVSIFIVMYLFSYGKFLYYKQKISLSKAIVLTAIFFLLHFLIFRSSPTNNTHMFYSLDATCYYHYTIPNFLNGCLVLSLMTDDILEDAWQKYKNGIYHQHPVKNGFLILAFYVALLSNLFCSTALAAYVGCQLLDELKQLLAKRIRFKECMQKNILRLIFIFSWALVQIWEVSGTRAHDLMADKSLLLSFFDVIYRIILDILSLNKIFVLFTVAVFIFTIVTYRLQYKKSVHLLSGEGEESQKNMSESFCPIAAGIFSLLYIIMLCTASGAYKISRPDVLFAIVFYGFMIISRCMVYLLDQYKISQMFLPLFIYLMLCGVNTNVRTFRDVTSIDIYSETAIDIAEDMINQILAVDTEGGEELQLFVPIMESYNDNWPLRPAIGNNIARALYKHGLTSKLITVEVVPTIEKNQEFMIESR